MSTPIGLGIPVPKMLPITGTFIAPLALYEFILAARVSMQRKETKTLLGERSSSSTTTADAGSDPLTVAVRGHGNFIEGVPFAIAIAAIAELNGANKKALSWALAILTIGRIAHVEAGLKMQGNKGLGRLVGTLCTQSFIVGVGAYAAFLVKGYWGF